PVDEQVDRIAGQPPDRDHAADPERQRVADRHPGAADLDCQLDRHVLQPAEIGAPVERGAALIELLVDPVLLDPVLVLGLHLVSLHPHCTTRSVKTTPSVFTSVVLSTSLRISVCRWWRALREVSSAAATPV